MTARLHRGVMSDQRIADRVDLIRAELADAIGRVGSRLQSFALTIEPPRYVCKDCEGTGMQHTGDGGTNCERCRGRGVTK